MTANIFGNDFTLDGMRDLDRAHRKIELQSPEDLTYLIAKVSRVARDKIDKHFPPDAAVQGEDKMRSRVEMLVDDYIRSTFNLAKPNLSINGMDSDEIEAELAKAQEGEEFEAFDIRLVQRIQDLSAQIEANTLELANLRRTAPSETAKRYHDLYNREDESMLAQVESEKQKSASRAAEVTLKTPNVERLEDIKQTWHTSSHDLDMMNEGLKAANSKMEDAQRSAAYVASL